MSFLGRIVYIFLPFVFGYFLSSIYRTVNAILAPAIMETTGMSVAMVGASTSVYFLAFALMQIPAGILVDCYGPRRVQSALFFVGSLGAILFGFSTGPILLILGMLLVGMGMSGGFTVGVVANRLWFNKQEFMLLNSLLFSLGSLGTVVSSWPMEALLDSMGWKWIVVSLAVITFIAAIVFLMIVPDPKVHPSKHVCENYIKGLKEIFHDRYFWKVAPIAMFSYSSIFVFQSYWISPWLQEIYGIAGKEASMYLLWVALAMIVSPIVFSGVCHLLPNWKVRYDWFAGIGALVALALQILIVSGVLGSSYVLWMLYSFFITALALLYSNLGIHFGVERAGRASAALNMLVFLGIFALQYLFSLIISLWAGESTGGGFMAAFWTLIVIQLLSFIWFCFGKSCVHE
jgi:MFS family permease